MQRRSTFTTKSVTDVLSERTIPRTWPQPSGQQTAPFSLEPSMPGKPLLHVPPVDIFRTRGETDETLG